MRWVGLGRIFSACDGLGGYGSGDNFSTFYYILLVTQSERHFSSVGHTVTDVRSLLFVSKVEAVELVHCVLDP